VARATLIDQLWEEAPLGDQSDAVATSHAILAMVSAVRCASRLAC
jgi:hypothetical protein